jgi:hypothetical protein
MSQPSYRNSSDQADSPVLTAMLGVATVFILVAVIALSYYLKTWYNVYLWDF